jgi:hypothetical protein
VALLDVPAVAQALDDSTLAYLGTDAGRGPVVAPVVFAVSGDRIWAVMPSQSARADVLRGHPRVGLLMRSPTSGTSVIACGEATVLDPTRPVAALASVPEAMRAPAGMLGYLRRNAGHLLGVVTSGEIGPRVVVSVVVDRVALATATAATHLDGRWANRAGAVDDELTETPATLDLTDVPDDIAGMAGASDDVAVGWRGSDGPLVLPGRWNADRSVASVPGAVLDAGGGDLLGPASVTFDSIDGTDLDDKRGMTLRGHGRARRAGSAVEIGLAVESIRYWNGADSGSVVVGAG